jgi:hypothetical protein
MGQAQGTHLHTALAEELVSRSERNLNNGTELGELFGSVGFDIGDTLKVGYKVSPELPMIQLASASDHSPISILTICFHAVNLSMRISDGLSSWGAVFFLICKGG